MSETEDEIVCALCGTTESTSWWPIPDDGSIVCLDCLPFTDGFEDMVGDG